MQKVMSGADEFKLANAVLVQEKIQSCVKPDYAERLQEVFNANLIVSSDMASDANAWVSKKNYSNF